jgi:hypothetical protein
MESRNESVQNLFLSFFKQNKKEQTDTQKEIDAVILIQRWWRENQWKRFYTIPNQEYLDQERIDTDVISTECNIGDHYQFSVKRKFDETDNEADDEQENQHPSDTSDTSDISDAKSDYEDEDEDEEDEDEDEEQESLINRYENLVVNHNNFIYDFFTSFFTFIYSGFKFMLGF